MFQTILALLARIGMALMTEKMLAQLLIWGAGKIVKSTKNTIDDEFYAQISDKLKKEFDIKD